MKFEPAIRCPINSEIYFTISSANVDKDNCVLAEIKAWNGSLLYTDKIRTSSAMRRKAFAKALNDKLQSNQMNALPEADIDNALLVLDDNLSRELAKGNTTATGAKGINLAAPEPWADPVTGIELLNSLAATYKRFVFTDENHYTAFPLWTLYTFCFDSFEISPLLLLTSATKRSGKSTSLSLLGALTCKPLPAANITAAVLFRVVEAVQPTLLVDEADTFLREKEELRGIINSGHTRATAQVLRCAGENRDEVRQFNTFSPKAIAMIGLPPSTIVDRSVRINLKRAPRNANVERLRLDRTGEFLPLQRKAARWAKDNAERLKQSDPVVPEAISSARDRDNWRPLLAIADLAGGGWPDRARQAAVALCGGDDSDSVSEMLIADIYNFFDSTDSLQVESAELVKHLVELEERPWAEFGRAQKPITTIRLASLLKPFEIKPGHWREGSKTVRGYFRVAFQEVFSRYITQVGGFNSAHSAQSTESTTYSEKQSAQTTHSVPTANDCKLLKSKPVPSVPTQNGENGEENPKYNDFDDDNTYCVRCEIQLRRGETCACGGDA